MKRSLPPLVGLLGLVLATGLAAGALGSRRDHGPVYSVQVVQLGLARDPAAWLGRTLRVRGMVQSAGCSCRDRSPSLLDRDGASRLPIAGWEPDPLLAALRRLPLAGGLVPGPRAVRRGALATYRVRLQTAPAPVCEATPCYAVFLLDAAP